MTRMWGLSPELLCDRHLLGEHAELHQLVGTVENHPHGEAIVRGHAAKGNVDTRLIEERHATLVVELANRGFAHDSPLSYDADLEIGAIDERANRADLADRCAACRERFEG